MKSKPRERIMWAVVNKQGVPILLHPTLPLLGTEQSTKVEAKPKPKSKRKGKS